MATKLKYVKEGALHKEEVEVARAEAPQLEQVNWRKDKGLRKLYFYAAIICIASATTGYDGFVKPFVFEDCANVLRSMLNNIRILKTWTNYFNDPQGGSLGLLTALYSIGSIASLPIA